MGYRITIILETSVNPFPTEESKIASVKELQAEFSDILTGGCSVEVSEVPND
jgi:hypothetical protein